MIDIAPAALSTARHVKGELSLLLLSPPFASQTTKSYPNAALPKRREPFTIMALPGDCSRGPQNAQPARQPVEPVRWKVFPSFFGGGYVPVFDFTSSVM